MPHAFRRLLRIGNRGVLLGSAAVLVVLALLLWWLLPLGEDSPGGRITISTGAESGVYQRYGDLLKTELNRDMPDLHVDLEPSEGSQENVARVANGDADFTIAAADAVKDYQRGHGAHADLLRGCVRLYDDYVQLVVPRDSDVDSVADLRGKRVSVGQRGSGVKLIADRVLKAVGLGPGTVDERLTGIDTAPKDLERGRIDAFFWSGGLPTKSVMDLSTTFSIKFVEMGGLVGKLHAQGGPSLYYRASDMPSDAYPGVQNVPVSTLAVANLLVTTARTDPELTERVTRTVIASRDEIGSVVHAAQLVDLRTAPYTDPLELHAGASRYYRSVKP